MKLATVVLTFLLGMGMRVQAAEITVFSTNAFKGVLEELVPQFERSSGHKVSLRFGPTSEMKARIEKGEAFDVAILTAAATDDLVKQAKLAGASRKDVARSGVGVAIRKGAKKPDLSSAEAFKRALLQAGSITYTGAGFTGANLGKIFERFGIAQEMKAKTRIAQGNAAEAVARGEAELGFTQVSEILHAAGADFAGPLPAEVQIYTVFSAAGAPNAREAAIGLDFVRFLSAPAATPVVKANGMEAAAGH